MNPSLIQNPRFEKFRRYFSAYAWYVFFILFGLLVIWCLRSDILLLSMIFSAPAWITNLLYSWGTFLVLIPYVLIVAGLESYLNQAAKKNLVRRRVLKILAYEAGAGLLVLGLMGILALLGYQPIL